MKLLSGILLGICVFAIFSMTFYVYSEDYEPVPDIEEDDDEDDELSLKYSNKRYIDSNRKRYPPGLDR